MARRGKAACLRGLRRRGLCLLGRANINSPISSLRHARRLRQDAARKGGAHWPLGRGWQGERMRTVRPNRVAGEFDCFPSQPPPGGPCPEQLKGKAWLPLSRQTPPK